MNTLFHHIGSITKKISIVDEALVGEEIESTLDDLSYSVGFPIFDDTLFQHGVAHQALKEQNRGRPTFGPSMADAWAAFRSEIWKMRGREFEIVEEIVTRDIVESCVSFGSPHSNFLARRCLGYEDEAPDMKLRRNTGFPLPKPRVWFGNGPDEQGVKRYGYDEGNWDLTVIGPDERPTRLTPRISKEGNLLEDYLVLSCVPNLGSSLTSSYFTAKAALNELLTQPDIDRSAESYHENIAKLRAASNDARLKKVLFVSGLHGPGTAAAKTVLGSPRRLRRLIDAIKDHGLEGQSWQAVYKVGSVVRRKTDAGSRDVPEPESIDLNPEVFGVDLVTREGLRD